jgi:3',5'-cyclic AMP phosphodiesterase CpdA
VIPSFFSVLLAVAVLCLGSCGFNVLESTLYSDLKARFSDSRGLPAPAPALPSQTNHFTFAIMADTQIRMEDKHWFSEMNTLITEYGIRFFLVLGDLTEHAKEDEAVLMKRTLDGTGIPYYVTVGNHDISNKDGWALFKRYFGPATYSVVIGKAVKFIFFDTASGMVGEEQFKWLQAELDDNRYMKIVGTHYPLVDTSGLNWQLPSKEERYKLISLLNAGKAAAYACGHFHGYAHTQISGFQHFITGSMYPYVTDAGDHGLAVFTYDNGTLTWIFRKFPL